MPSNWQWHGSPNYCWEREANGVCWTLLCRSRNDHEKDETNTYYLNLPPENWTEDGSGWAVSAWMQLGIIARTMQPTVYFMEAVGVNRVKIGCSIDIPNRLKTVQACSPVDILVIHAEPGGKSHEQALHKRFSADRCHGEWFQLSEDLREYINESILHSGGLC